MCRASASSQNATVFNVRRIGLALGMAALLTLSPLSAAAQAIPQEATHTVLSAAGEFLVVNDPLQPAEAIIILDGGSPQRETEAAALYRAGLAPRLILVPGAPHAGSDQQEWAPRYELLRSLRVPADAISVANGQAYRTLDELELAAAAVGQPGAPVILVTSKAHARRVGVIWQLVTAGLGRGIVRVAGQDRFDPYQWWDDPESTRQALHEFTGLIGLAGEALGARL